MSQRLSQTLGRVAPSGRMYAPNTSGILSTCFFLCLLLSGYLNAPVMAGVLLTCCHCWRGPQFAGTVHSSCSLYWNTKMEQIGTKLMCSCQMHLQWRKCININKNKKKKHLQRISPWFDRTYDPTWSMKEQCRTSKYEKGWIKKNETKRSLTFMDSSLGIMIIHFASSRRFTENLLFLIYLHQNNKKKYLNYFKVYVCKMKQVEASMATAALKLNQAILHP